MLAVQMKWHDEPDLARVPQFAHQCPTSLPILYLPEVYFKCEELNQKQKYEKLMKLASTTFKIALDKLR